MDLRQNKITVGELLDHPGARAALQKRIPMMLKHPLTGAARTVTLEQILSFAEAYLPPNKVNDILTELKKV